jgi:hypothetical protein
LNAVVEEMEAKVAEKISELRTKVNQRLDEQTQGKSRDIMQKIIAMSEQLQEHQSESRMTMKQHQATINGIKTQNELTD